MPKLKGFDISTFKSEYEKISSKATMPSVSKDILEQVRSLDALIEATSKSSDNLLNINPLSDFLTAYKNAIPSLSSLQETLGLSSYLGEQYKPPSYLQEALNPPSWQRMIEDMNKSNADWFESYFPKSLYDSFQGALANFSMQETLSSKLLDTSQSYQSYVDSILAATGSMFSSALYPASNALKMLSSESTKLSELMSSFSALDFEKNFPRHTHDGILPPNEPQKSNDSQTEISDTQLKELQKDISEIADSFGVDELKGQQKFEDIMTKWEIKNPTVARFIPYFISAIISAIFFILGLWLNSCTHITTINIIVKENPQNKSKPIERLEKGTHVQVVESVRYYYKIMYIDEKTQTQREGWVAKRNIHKG